MNSVTAAAPAGKVSERALIWFYVGAFLGPFGSTIANVLIPTLTDAFSTDVQLVTISIAAYMYTFAACLLFSGAISDTIGTRQAVTAGCLVFGVASLVCAVAPSIEIFIAGRALQGVGNAFDGFTVQVSRTVTEPDGNIRRRDFTSHYLPARNAQLVGTG